MSEQKRKSSLLGVELSLGWSWVQANTFHRIIKYFELEGRNNKEHGIDAHLFQGTAEDAMAEQHMKDDIFLTSSWYSLVVYIYKYY